MTMTGMARLQGTYYLAGVWPLLHMRSFEAVTRAKPDQWPVQTTGAVDLWGAAYLMSARRRGPSRDLANAIAATAVGVGMADSWYVSRGAIVRTCLLDGAAEAVLAGAWCVALDHATGQQLAANS